MNNVFDIAVVGAGPAGMTAALYGARAGKRVVLFEGAMPGGQILQSERIENYPAFPAADGYTFAANLKAQVDGVGVVTEGVNVDKIEQRDGIFALFADKTEYFSKTVILATGQTHRKLGVPGEEKFIGRGVSFCATCDGMFYRGKEVAVVGGGNTAVQDALVLSEYCSCVYLIHRRDTLRAEQELAERMKKKENIRFIGDTVVEEIMGEMKLECLKLCNTKSGEVTELAVAGLFEAVGYLPQNAAFATLVTLSPDGYVDANEACETNVHGLFAAGDGRRKAVRQLTTATSDGTVAALSAVEYLSKNA